MSDAGEVLESVWEDGDSPSAVSRLRTWLASADLATFTTLNLRFCGIGDDGATALARSPTLRALDWLWLFANDIEDSGCLDLSRSEALERCTTLDLRGNRISEVAIDGMCRWHPPQLRRLLLGGNPLSDPGGRMLARAPFFNQLEVLDVSDTGLGETSATVLVAATEASEKLQVLDLRFNGLSELSKTQCKARLKERFRC